MPLVTLSAIRADIQPMEKYTPQITDTEYKHSIVSSKHQPLASLLTHIQGSSWTVDYYSQVIGQDEEPSTYDPAQTGVYQQYTLIHHYELKLQDNLSTSIEATDQTASITGTAMMYPYMKPNYGDVFIADVGDGQAGLFTITSVEKKSMFKQACYEINFILSDYLNPTIEKDLFDKTVKVTQFVKDFMTYGQNPIIATLDKLKLDKLDSIYKDALADWLSEFFSFEFKTILVPNGNNAVYDPFIVNMVTSVFDKNLHPYLSLIDLPNVDDRALNEHTSIWQALVYKQDYMFKNCFKNYSVVSSRSFNSNPFVQAAYFSGLDSVITPVADRKNADEKMGIASPLSGSRITDKEDYDPRIPDIASFDTYLFSRHFYTPHIYDKQDTLLEVMVTNYLNNRRNDWEILIDLYTTKSNWSTLQRFYYTPVLILLIIAEIRGY